MQDVGKTASMAAAPAAPAAQARVHMGAATLSFSPLETARISRALRRFGKDKLTTQSLSSLHAPASAANGAGAEQLAQQPCITV